MSTIFSNYLNEFFKNNLSYCEAQCERRSSYGNECCFCSIYESIFFNCSEATYATASLIRDYITPGSSDVLTYNEYVNCAEEYKKMEKKFEEFVRKNALEYGFEVKFEEDGIYLLYKEKGIVGVIKEFGSLSNLINQICKIYQKI